MKRSVGFLTPSLKNLHYVKALRERRQKAIAEGKQRLFGYVKGLPEEKQWLKPLQGRSYTQWYFPSRYLFPDFHMEHYLQMQTNRFIPQPSHPAIRKLSYCLWYTVRKKLWVRALLSALDESTFIENPTLQDLYGLYRTLYNENPLKFEVPPQIWRYHGFSWFYMQPHLGISLIEREYSKVDGEASKRFEEFLDVCKSTNNVEELQKTVQNQLESFDDMDIPHLERIASTQILEYGYESPSNETPKRINKMREQIRFGEDNETESSNREATIAAIDAEHPLYNFYKQRRRFVDPLYHRRRLAFLKKLSRNRIKSEKERFHYAGKHFMSHPNSKELWPENKGIVSRKWPSPYH